MTLGEGDINKWGENSFSRMGYLPVGGERFLREGNVYLGEGTAVWGERYLPVGRKQLFEEVICPPVGRKSC